MRGLVEREGLADRVELDSAGTGAWHVGEAPDARSTAAARARGIVMEGAAREVLPVDFDTYDLLLAADRQNVGALRAVARDDEDTAKIHLLRAFDPASAAAGDLDVPDPYYGGEDGFEHVFDLIEAACEGLLDRLRADGRV